MATSRRLKNSVSLAQTGHPRTWKGGTAEVRKALKRRRREVRDIKAERKTWRDRFRASVTRITHKFHRTRSK